MGIICIHISYPFYISFFQIFTVMMVQPGVGHGLGLPGMTSQPTAKRILKVNEQPCRIHIVLILWVA